MKKLFTILMLLSLSAAPLATAKNHEQELRDLKNEQIKLIRGVMLVPAVGGFLMYNKTVDKRMFPAFAATAELIGFVRLYSVTDKIAKLEGYTSVYSYLLDKK